MTGDPVATVEEQPAQLWTLEELNQLVSRSGNPAETLANVVELVHGRFCMDVCSVYLLEPDRANLVLAATIGLRADSIGRVRMRITEGLVGLVAEQVRPVVVHDTTTHPRFKYFRDAGEEPYRTFLGVPVTDRAVLQAVLVVQTAAARTFSEDEVGMLASAGAQLAPIISEARAVGQFVAPLHQRLAAIARNLWWSWDDESGSLFREIDPVLWQSCDHNPIALLERIVFVEDYDIDVGRHLVQGVDVWLNNPRRPLEACGTSGQKVVLNGGLNLSVLDGWWAEAYDGLNGFAIGHGETHSSTDMHDSRDASALLTVLRKEVVAQYYDRDRDGLPREWIARMKRAIRTLGWRFSADRMVQDYVLKAYIPAAGGTSSEMNRD